MSPSQMFYILTCFSLQFLCDSFLKLKTSTSTLPLTIWNYMAPTLTNLKWAFDTLLYNPFSFSAPDRLYDNIQKTGTGELIRITRYERNPMEGEQCSAENAEQCAVCLGQVQEGEEIGELRCSHVFHLLCLERWVQFKHKTCPLCRGSLAAPPLNAAAAAAAGVADFGVEVLFFKFCSFGSNDDERDSWWLR
ncbi:E3 ubiquitin-protein ligase RHA2A [Morus notabilis]|nr:E3 ubiquitin-protein ligase RHA2A [Morus notabilis]